MHQSKRRKLTSKTSGQVEYKHNVTYQYKREWRCRRYANNSIAAQNMPQLLQTHLLQDTSSFASLKATNGLTHYRKNFALNSPSPT